MEKSSQWSMVKKQGLGIRDWGLEIRGQRSEVRGQGIHPSPITHHPSSASPRSGPRPRRKGVLLLLILALLAMFAMIGIAFVLLTGHSQRSARTGERIGRVVNSSKSDLKQAFHQIIRGSPAPGFNFTNGAGTPFVAGDTITSGAGASMKSGIIVEVNDNAANGHMTVAWTAGMAFAMNDNITDTAGGKTATVASLDLPTASVVGAHSVLEDMCGNGYVNGVIAGATAMSGGQLIEIQTTLAADVMARHIGCVLTITGNCNATTGVFDSSVAVPDYLQSTRIVGVSPATGDPQILAFPDGASLGPVQNSSGQWVRVSFLINGTPFSGAGFGYNPASGQLDLAYNTSTDSLVTWTTGANYLPVALLPNFSANRNPAGGANSDYTAPDFQHMFLGAQVPNIAAPGGVQTLPSFHRPALTRYWANRAIGGSPDLATASGMATAAATMASGYAPLLRAIALRPLPIDHPNFTGSNPTYTGTTPYASGFNPLWNGVDGAIPPGTFSWDVDNDGDGVPDSIWVDLGLPVRTTAEGRQYKPLAAVLCVDMDGRLNLNAHGSLAQADSANYGNLVTLSGGVTAGTPTVRGQGLGPADINLTPLLGTQTNCRTLLVGNGTYDGRYGQHDVPGIGTSSETVMNNKWFEYAAGRSGSYWNFSAVNNAGSYGSPPDPFGVGAMGLDDAGRPVYGGMRYNGADYMGFGSGITNSPYEMNLGANGIRGLVSTAAGNSPFSAAEMERLLRPYDQGATTLPERLGILTIQSWQPGHGYVVGDIVRPRTANGHSYVCFQTGTSHISNEPAWPKDGSSIGDSGVQWRDKGNSSAADSLLLTAANRKSFTTESWDIPSPNIDLPSDKRAALILLVNPLPASLRTKLQLNGPRYRLLDLMKARLATGIRTANPGWTDDQVVTEVGIQLTPLFSPDLLAGRKMNINRPFGNGQDDDGNNAVDDYAEMANTVTLSGSAVPFNYNETGAAANTQTARQLEARYLYVLMCLTCDLDYLNTQALNGLPPNFTNTAAYIAQWAVNAVDFKSRDSIMTRFDYDPTFANPSATPAAWNQTATVWGCKKPELLISETLAFHDRRTKDTSDDPSGKTVANGDSGFDQSYRPQGSLFVELYNPSSPYQPYLDYLYDVTIAFTGGTTSTSFQVGQTITSGAKSALIIGSNDNNSATGSLTVKMNGAAFAANDSISSNGSPSKSATVATVTTALNLAKVTPAAAGVQYPVWRMAVAQPVFDGAEIRDPDGPAGGTLTIEREIYFVSSTNAALPTTTPAGQIQYRPGATPSAAVVPGGYAVIGPGENQTGYQNSCPKRTYLGFRNGQLAGDNDTRHIDLSLITTTPVRRNTNYIATEPTTVGTVATLAIDVPNRLSVSEPVTGTDYTAMETGFHPNLDGRYVDTNGNPVSYDIPFDIQRTDGDSTFVMTNGTTEAYRVIYLQRLANPLLPYDGTTNPYRTVDMMPVDLTAFNGIANDSNDLQLFATPPDADPVTADRQTRDTHFQTRQRGENNDDIAGYLNTEMNLWKQEPVIKTINDATRFPDAAALSTDSYDGAAIPSHYFARGLKHSLGYLNQPFGPPQAGPRLGDPATPFAWLAWNNRPYVTPLELLQVPTLRSSKLWVNRVPGTTAGNSAVKDTSNPDYDIYFDALQAASAADAAINPYLAPLVGAAAAGGAPYPHLMNFLGSKATATTWQPSRPYPLGAVVIPTVPNGFSYICTVAGVSRDTEPTPWPIAPGAPVSDGAVSWQVDGSPQFHRILEYLDVPSPFIGTETWMNPTAALSPFAPPFNRISAYREPGRINLNTIYDPNVFYGLMAGFPSMQNADSWQAFAQNRRGGPFGFTPLDAASQNYPTEFTRPYRSHAGGAMVPPVTIGAYNDVLRPNLEIDATLLRTGGVPWQPSQPYALGAVVTPTAPNGRTYVCIQAGTSAANEPASWPIDGSLLTDSGARWRELSQPLFQCDVRAWEPLRSYAVGMTVSPVTANGHIYTCEGAGTSGGGEPGWPTNGSTVAEGVLTWRDAGCDDPNRNPYFRYQGIQRLGNLVTTRSNVFAVWITIGYFEVKPWGSVDAAHPDGYQLDAELGSDTGEIERHRAFYMYDRTLPVGFQRGQDLNVDKAILVERFIE